MSGKFRPGSRPPFRGGTPPYEKEMGCWGKLLCIGLVAACFFTPGLVWIGCGLVLLGLLLWFIALLGFYPRRLEEPAELAKKVVGDDDEDEEPPALGDANHLP